MTKKAFKEYLQPWRERVESVFAFLGALGGEVGEAVEGELEDGRKRIVRVVSGVEVEVVELFEPCGPTIEDEEIEVLVLTEETRGGGEFVNKVRKERGMSKLAVEVVSIVGDEGGEGGKVSSTDARRREALAAEKA